MFRVRHQEAETRPELRTCYNTRISISLRWAMNLEERHWENLLADIQGRQVIPVIGPELLIIEIEGKPVTLSRYLAE